MKTEQSFNEGHSLPSRIVTENDWRFIVFEQDNELKEAMGAR